MLYRPHLNLFIAIHEASKALIIYSAGVEWDQNCRMKRPINWVIVDQNFSNKITILQNGDVKNTSLLS